MNQPWIYMRSPSWSPLPIQSLWVFPVHQPWALVACMVILFNNAKFNIWELECKHIGVFVFFCYCCSVAKLCPTLCNPVDYSMIGFPVLHYLSPSVCLNSCPLSQWCHPTISSSVTPFSCLQSASWSFSMSQLVTSGDHSIGASVLAQSFQWIFRVDFL